MLQPTCFTFPRRISTIPYLPHLPRHPYNDHILLPSTYQVSASHDYTVEPECNIIIPAQDCEIFERGEYFAFTLEHSLT